jgi:hypothetical protein
MPDVAVPEILRSGSKQQLLVDGRPFLVLGLQWDCDSCMSRDEMVPLFGYARRLHANTAALPLYWSEVEPEPGNYQFELLDERLHEARANGLRIVLLWFATWKNACSFYCPDYVRDDPSKYPLALSAQGVPAPSLCPLGEQTFARDRAALVSVLEHLRDVDQQHTVILFQIENEPGLITTARCHCARCDEQFVLGTWEEDWGPDADEAFSAACIADYIDRLAQSAKQVLPIPYYVNVAIPAAAGATPGRYFSGGAVPWMLELFRSRCPSLDLIAPDIYASGYRDFQHLSAHYRQLSGPLYVAEHSSDPAGRAERNVFYAIGEHAAIGFDPWAIDAAFPDIEAGEAFLDVATGVFRPHALRLSDSYLAIARAMAPIIEAQGTDRLFTFVQEDGERRSGFCAEGCDVLLDYHDPERKARGFVIQESPDTFLLIGVGFSASFREPRPSVAARHISHAEWGYFDDNRFVTLHRIRREHPELEGRPLQMPEPGVARVVLRTAPRGTFATT